MVESITAYHDITATKMKWKIAKLSCPNDYFVTVPVLKEYDTSWCYSKCTTCQMMDKATHNAHYPEVSEWLNITAFPGQWTAQYM